MQALKLYLELEEEEDAQALAEADWKVLRKYGKVEKSISRTILAPATMTFHALNHAIQRLFGWRNSGSYHFSFDEELFFKMTGNRFSRWKDLCGIYLRFPPPIVGDGYWNDIYAGGILFPTWQKKRYCGPYEYRGFDENYLESQIRESRFEASIKELKNRSEDLKLDKVEAVENPNRILERLSISDLLVPKGDEIEPYEEIEEKVFSSTPIGRDAVRRRVIMMRILKLHKIFPDKSLSQAAKDELHEIYWDTTREFTPTTLPVTNTVFYSYGRNTGKKWKVRITCEESLEMEEIDGVSQPICIEYDGLPVFEQIGGLKDYCEFLKKLKESPDKEERQELRKWAKGLGWTRRGRLPKNIL